jgi:hypothetical protein
MVDVPWSALVVQHPPQSRAFVTIVLFLRAHFHWERFFCPIVARAVSLLLSLLHKQARSRSFIPALPRHYSFSPAVTVCSWTLDMTMLAVKGYPPRHTTDRTVCDACCQTTARARDTYRRHPLAGATVSRVVLSALGAHSVTPVPRSPYLHCRVGMPCLRSSPTPKCRVRRLLQTPFTMSFSFSCADTSRSLGSGENCFVW